MSLADNIDEMQGSLTLTQLVRDAYATAREKGWHDEPRNVGEMLMLCVSELAEAMEEVRRTDNLLGIYWNITRADGNEKPEGFGVELADTVIRIADLCGMLGIDLEKCVREKMAYNRTRGYRHGGKRC